jgi:hypothetical protein
MHFVKQVAAKAQKLNHPPDIDIRFDKVMLMLTTHDEGGITEMDFALAKQCDAVLAKSFAPCFTSIPTPPNDENRHALEKRTDRPPHPDAVFE